MVDHVIVSADGPPDPEIELRCTAAGTRLYSLDADVFAKLSDTRSPQPAMAVVEAPSFSFDDRFAVEGGLMLALVDVADPGNVGTLLRTAEATGCIGVLVSGSTVDVLSPKVVRASAGSVLRVPIGEVADTDLLDTLKRAGRTVVATDIDAPNYDEVELPDSGVAYLLGSEAHGLPGHLLAGSDLRVSIPMAGLVESLNVATVGSVLAFDHVHRDRRAQDQNGRRGS